MRIRLINFKCYIDREFEFVDNDITLILGKSGCGKTSIMEGILFALFGKMPKIIRRGASSCTVEFDFSNLRIVRTQKPNKLIVNNELIGDAAQGEIYRVLGTSFHISGYISQMGANSFLSMTPAEKLRTLEHIVINVDVATLKQKIQAKLTERTREFETKQTEYQLLNQILSQMEVIELPEEYHDIDVESKICDVRCDIQRLSGEIETTRAEIFDLQIEFNIVLRREYDLEALFSERQRLEDDVADCNNKLNQFEPDIEERLAACYNVQKRANAIQRRRELERSVDNKKSMLAEIENKHKLAIAELEAMLWQDGTREEIMETIGELNKNIESKYRAEQLMDDIKALEDDESIDTIERRHIENIKKYGIAVVCPECDTSLRYDEGILTKSHGDVSLSSTSSDMSIVDKSRRALLDAKFRADMRRKKQQELILLFDDFEQEVDYVELKDDAVKYIHDNENIERRLLKLRTSQQPPLSLIEAYERDRLALSELTSQNNNNNENDNGANFDDDSEVDNDLIMELQGKIVSRRSLLTTLSKLNAQLENCLIGITNFSMTTTSLSLQKLIQSKDKFITLKSSELKHLQKSLDELLKVQESIVKYKKYENEREKLNALGRDVEMLRGRMTAAESLKRCVLETESHVLLSFLDALNETVQKLVDEFFPTECMTFALCAFKDGTDGLKPMINVELMMNGEAFDISMLSGGQMTRLNVAIVCALNKLLNTPLLMLDEATASLDEETTAIIIDVLKSNLACSILNISHQATEGIFDHVLRL